MSTIVSENQLLLADRLAPITTSMGFLEVEPRLAAHEFAKWQEEIKSGLGIQVRSRQVQGSLEEALAALLPLRQVDTNRSLFIPTTGEWTTYLDNGYRGTDPAAIGYLASRLRSRSVWVVAKPHTLQKSGKPQRGRPGALIIEVYGPDPTEHLNLVREIRLQNDAGRWEFFLQGTPFPFEETESYSSKRKTDRFTFNMMELYLRELGLRPFDEDYYLPASAEAAILVELSGNLPSSARDVTLAEARRLGGIDD